MSDRVKTVHDPVHGGIRVDGFFLEIMDRHEMQRLRGVKQLGMGNFVFPGANHTRFEHCLGTYYLAGRMAKAIGLSEEDSLAVRTAAMMHDICHAPFSHTLEAVMEDATGLDHMELARNLICGKGKVFRDRDADLLAGSGSIADILESNGIDPVEVCDLIAYPESTERDLDNLTLDGMDHFPSKDYIHQIIHGPVDADQMDYLMRDAHYTGVVMGNIDVDRLLSTMRVVNDRICIERGGAPAAEGLMVSRALMYSSVYYHQTVRVLERMVTKAVLSSDLDLSEIYLWDDSDMTQALLSAGESSSRLMRLVQNRMFYKKALEVSAGDVDEELSRILMKYKDHRKRIELEQHIADKAGLDVSEVVLEMTSSANLGSAKIKIGKTDVSIVGEDGKVRPLTRTSPIAKALQSRDSFSWSMLVACPEDKKEAVARATSKVLGL